MEKEKLLERQRELIKTIEALDGVIRSKDWQVIREMFEKLSLSLERQLLTEAKRPLIEEEKIYFLQGQLATAKRYDLITYQDMLRKELQGIKLKLQ